MPVDVEVARDHVTDGIAEVGAVAAITWAGPVPPRPAARPDADERRREPVPQREAATDLGVGEQRAAQLRGRQRGRVQEAHVGAARVGDATRDLVRLEPHVDLVEPGDRRDEADTRAARGTGATERSPTPSRPTRRRTRRRARSAQPLDLADGGADESLQPAARRRGDDRPPAEVPSADSSCRARSEASERSPDLDLDDPLLARELQHPRHRRPRDPEALGDLLLGEMVLVVELRGREQGRGPALLASAPILGDFVRHSFPWSQQDSRLGYTSVLDKCAPMAVPLTTLRRAGASSPSHRDWLAGEAGAAARLRARRRGSRAASAGSTPRPAGGRPAAAAVDHDPHDARLRARRAARPSRLRTAGRPRPARRSASASRTASTAAGTPRSPAGRAGPHGEGGLPARLRPAGRGELGDRRAPGGRARCSRRPSPSSRSTSGPRTRARWSSPGTARWSEPEAYRGANANMHMVEAFLAAGDATGDGVWYDRARRIAERLIRDVARAHDWRVVEHFDAGWRPLPDYNADQPRHPFRPFGVTPGHGLEWARLVLQIGAGLPEAPDWILEAARGLFARAVAGRLARARRLRLHDRRRGPPGRQRPAALGRVARRSARPPRCTSVTGERDYERCYRTALGLRRPAPDRPRARQLARRAGRRPASRAADVERQARRLPRAAGGDPAAHPRHAEPGRRAADVARLSDPHHRARTIA